MPLCLLSRRLIQRLLRSGYNSDFTAVTYVGCTLLASRVFLTLADVLSGTQGNIVFLHLLVDALPLQPCSPTFLAARNGEILTYIVFHGTLTKLPCTRAAIILADTNRYAGANKCLLWKVRGLFYPLLLSNSSV